MNPPAGCRFHPRCPLAMAICQTDVPRALTFGEHVVRCHAVEQEQARVGGDPAALSDALSRQMAIKAHPLAEAAVARCRTVIIFRQARVELGELRCTASRMSRCE